MQSLPSKNTDPKKKLDGKEHQEENKCVARNGDQEDGYVSREELNEGKDSHDHIPTHPNNLPAASSQNQSTTHHSKDDSENENQPSPKNNSLPGRPGEILPASISQPDAKTETVFVTTSDKISHIEASAILEATAIKHLRFLVASMLFPEETKANRAIIAGYAPKSAAQQSVRLNAITHISRVLTEFDRKTGANDDMELRSVESMDKPEMIAFYEDTIRDVNVERRLRLDAAAKMSELMKWTKAGNASQDKAHDFAQILQDAENNR